MCSFCLCVFNTQKIQYSVWLEKSKNKYKKIEVLGRTIPFLKCQV